ncbi:MAG TPA: acylphosphatase [Candidatus Limnocylindria bacterium]|nr:acylphosphatase [Candidatus Limnocylindria bacterium]
MVPCVRLIITGRVQGVGFRQFVHRHAAALGVFGWVRNRDDGSVEVEAEGKRRALQSLISELWKGPLGGRVTDVNEHWSECRPRYREFEITP